MYISYLVGLVLCLFWNIICVSAAWAKGSGMLTASICFFPTRVLIADVYGSRPRTVHGTPVDAVTLAILFSYLKKLCVILCID